MCSLLFLFHNIFSANKAKLLLGIPRDPDLALYVTQMEEEENENNEDEKPKVYK